LFIDSFIDSSGDAMRGARDRYCCITSQTAEQNGAREYAVVDAGRAVERYLARSFPRITPKTESKCRKE